jgi:bifunctional non-homologous end joining protein LigD
MAQLAEYKRKRDFKITAEPRGRVGHRRGHSFVIQEHAATRLHYDFRLEADGVLKSWAVPKGPSLDPKVKRLAVQVEDHPLSYAGFEGTIPPHQYGAGEVIVWDRGTWHSEGDALAQLRKGHLRFTLEGEKLHGGFSLIRTRQGEGKPSWLLVKADDEAARPESEYDITRERPESVISGKVLDVETGAARPRARRPVAKRVAVAPVRSQPARSTQAVGQDPLPDFIAPQLATLVSEPPREDYYLSELKFDGYRALARVHGGKATLYTRRGNDWTHKFAAIARILSGFAIDSAFLDGEIVVLGEDGESDFQALQNALDAGVDAPLYYQVFDLLYLNGVDLRRQPLVERKELLRALLANNPHERIRYSDHYVGSAPAFFQKARARHLEGILCKDGRQPYVSGRTTDWLKVKCKRQQEFVIVGYSTPQGSRQHLGALLLATRDPGAHTLRYVGRVGTGFSRESLSELRERLEARKTDEPPVANPARVAGVTWVRPELICQIQFGHFTQDGLLRQAVFMGLRDDKKADEVSVELPVKPPGRRRRAVSRRDADGAAPTAADVPLSHPDKVLYPPDGPTKQELADYYDRVASRIWPYVKGRPLALLRCPNGYTGSCFFQKHADLDHPEPGIAALPVTDKSGTSMYRYLQAPAGLRSLVQLGSLELHVWGARADDLEHPDELVFDLDPGPDVPWRQTVAAARRLRERLLQLGLKSFPKLTGGKGLHLHVPIAPRYGWEQIKAFCHAVARQLEDEQPEQFTSNASKAKRPGKIYIDYLRNQRGALYVAPLSPRAREGAAVAAPITWQALTARRRPDSYTVRTIGRYLQTYKRDPWAGYTRLAQRIKLLE